jgi:hypothetical protein
MNTPAVNPISTFEPTVGAHVHDTLNNIWMTLTADDVDEMQRELREHGRRDWAIENWDGFILDAWLPPEATPPATIPTPGPDGSRIQAVRLALKANAIEDFSLHRDEIEAIIAEARAEGIAEATKLVETAEGIPEKDRERLIVRLQQL